VGRSISKGHSYGRVRFLINSFAQLAGQLGPALNYPKLLDDEPVSPGAANRFHFAGW